MSSIRINPSIPNFTIKPLNSIENSTEASTCAFNSQDKHGHIGTLTPKPIKKKKLIKLDTRELEKK